MDSTLNQLPTLDKGGQGARRSSSASPGVLFWRRLLSEVLLDHQREPELSWNPPPPRRLSAARPHPRCRSAARWRRPGGPASTGKTRLHSRGGRSPAASAPLRHAPRSSRPPPACLAAPTAEALPSSRRPVRTR